MNTKKRLLAIIDSINGVSRYASYDKQIEQYMSENELNREQATYALGLDLFLLNKALIKERNQSLEHTQAKGLYKWHTA